MSKATIALVNNERNILSSLRVAFEAAGYSVRCYSGSAEAFEALSLRPADLAILDGYNPPLGGEELCRRLRRLSDMPIVFLSPSAGELRDAGLDAAEYVESPFSLRHLVELIGRVLRQHRAGRMRPPVLTRGALVLDVEGNTCHWSGERVYLNGPEMRMLHALASRPGDVCTSMHLMAAAYSAEVPVDAGVVDEHVRRLQSKLARMGAAAARIEHVAGLAYRFTM